jgi:hypothetical protein
MIFKVRKMNAHQAAKLLETVTVNRPVSQRTVDRYVADMKAGKWRMTGEPIIISESGHLLDGQHRLWAIVQADVEVELAVASGVADEAIWSIDMGRSRTASQVLGMTGQKYAIKTVAISRVLTTLENPGRERPQSVDDVRGMLAKHKGIEWVFEQPNVGTNGPLYSAGVLAAFAILREKFPKEAEALWLAYSTGADLSRGDPLLTIRNYLANAASRGNSNLSVAKCRRMLTALMYRLRGEPMMQSKDGMEGVNFFFSRNGRRGQVSA